MKKLIFACIAFVAFSVSSCSVTSNTMIKSNERFVLGNNHHGAFSVTLFRCWLTLFRYCRFKHNGTAFRSTSPPIIILVKNLRAKRLSRFLVPHLTTEGESHKIISENYFMPDGFDAF